MNRPMVEHGVCYGQSVASTEVQQQRQELKDESKPAIHNYSD